MTPPKPDLASATPSSTDQAKFIHKFAVAGLIVCPAIILLPPRKLDIYTIALLAGTFVSANHLTYHYSGRSFTTRWSDRFNSIADTGSLPPKAAIIQEQLRQEREMRDMKATGGNASITEQVEKMRQDKERSMLQKVWYGQEGENWKQKRDEKEKKALEEGKGYGDLIIDQIWEVWNWGKTEEGNEDEKEEGGKK